MTTGMTCVGSKTSMMLVVAIMVPACRAREESAAPGDAFGCVGAYAGRDVNCTELDLLTSPEERQAFAARCTNGALQQLEGRLVRHCREGAVARCSLPAEKSTQLYSKDQADEPRMRGARIGCKIRGGTFEGPR